MLLLFYPQKSHRHLHWGICPCSSAKVRNKLEIKKEKGEKFENNVGMTIFLQKYLEDCFLICIFATSNVCLTIRVESREGKTSPPLPILESRSLAAFSFVIPHHKISNEVGIQCKFPLNNNLATSFEYHYFCCIGIHTIILFDVTT